MTLRGLLREPLVHFLALGLLLFANPVFTAAASPGPWEVVSSYTLHGIEHIWQGIVLHRGPLR